MLPVVVRTSQEGLTVLVQEWLPSGLLHLRTDQEVSVGQAQDTRLVLPDGREVLLYGKIETVEHDDRGVRVTVRLGPENDAALAVLRRAAEPRDLELDLPSPRELVPSVDALLHGSSPQDDAGEPAASERPPPAVAPPPSLHLTPAGLTSARPDELLILPNGPAVVALAPPFPSPPPPARTPPPPVPVRTPPPPPAASAARTFAPAPSPSVADSAPTPILPAAHESPPPPVPRPSFEQADLTPPPLRAPSPLPALAPPIPTTPSPLPATPVPPLPTRAATPSPVPRPPPPPPPAPPPPPSAREQAAHSALAAQVRQAADELGAAFTEIATMGLSADRRRAAILRRAIDALRPIEHADALAELLVRILPLLPASGREDRTGLERALLELLPAPALLHAATSIARQAPMLAAVGGAEAERRFDTATRIVTLAVATRARKLDADGQMLLRALSESGAPLVRRMPPEMWPFVMGAKYLRPTREAAQQAFAPLEAAATASEYQAEIAQLEPALELLRHERCWEALSPLLVLVARHRDLPRAPFAERPFLAASVTDRFFAGNTLAELARAFSEASGENRKDLVRILAAAGAPAALQLVDILKRSSDVGLRNEALSLLRVQSDASRRAILYLLKNSEVEWSVVQNLLPILGEIGQEADMNVIAGYREDGHMQVRRAALEGMAALGGRRAEAALLRGLDDKARIVQVRALNLLGQVRSTDPNTLRYISELIRDTGAPDEDEDLVCAGIEALALIGNVPLPDRVGTVEDLLVKALEGTRRGALARFVRGSAGGLWQRPTVRRVLCSALGRIGLDNAEEALKKVAYDAADPVQRDADQAIFAIAARRRALGK